MPIEQFKSKMFDTSIAKKCRYFYPVNQGVNTEDNNSENAKQIIKKMGGDLNDPNFKMPKGLENVSLDDLISNMINDMNKQMSWSIKKVI